MGRCLLPLPGDTEEKTYEAGVKGNEEHRHKDAGHPECGFQEGKKWKACSRSSQKCISTWEQEDGMGKT